MVHDRLGANVCEKLQSCPFENKDTQKYERLVKRVLSGKQST